jgi:hypothetical protein
VAGRPVEGGVEELKSPLISADDEGGSFTLPFSWRAAPLAAALLPLLGPLLLLILCHLTLRSSPPCAFHPATFCPSFLTSNTSTCPPLHPTTTCHPSSAQSAHVTAEEAVPLCTTEAEERSWKVREEEREVERRREGWTGEKRTEERDEECE